MENCENSFDSSENSNSKNFEFKYVPRKEFEKIVMKVRERRVEHSWHKFCSISSTLDVNDADFCITPSPVVSSEPVIERDNEDLIKFPSIFATSTTKSEVHFDDPRNHKTSSDLQKLTNVENSTKSIAQQPSIVEKVEESVNDVVDIVSLQKLRQLKIEDDDNSRIEVKNEATVSSRTRSCILTDIEQENVDWEYEIVKLCKEIEIANSDDDAVNADIDVDDDATIVDLTFNEEKLLKNIMDKAQPPFPAVELKSKLGSEHRLDGDESTNENNVWNVVKHPKTPNQIKLKSGKQRQVKRVENLKSVVKKSSSSISRSQIPSDVSTTATQNVEDVNVNEKSHVDVKKNKKKLQLQDLTSNLRKDENSEVVKNSAVMALGRCEECLSKIYQYLDYVHEICEHPPEMEDMSDLRKRQKRASEFSNRFARNHLYQIGRIGEELRLMPDNPIEIATKVNSLFQVIMQAVQTYLKNVEMFIYNSYPDKLLVLVDFIVNAMRICFDKSAFDKNDLVVQNLLQKCKIIRSFLMMNRENLPKFMSMSKHPSYSSLYSSGSMIMMMKQKSPYDTVLRSRLRNVKYSKSHVSGNSRNPNAKQAKEVNKKNSHFNVHDVRRSPSNVSTLMGRLKDDELKEFDDEEKAHELEIMEMLKKISHERLEEILQPFVGVDVVKSKLRVTSDIKKDDKMPAASLKSSNSSSKHDDVVMRNRKVKEQTLRERLHYIQQMNENPLYINQTIPEPWKLFARISDKLFDEMLDEVINELDFGEKSFLDSFLKSELRLKC